MEKDEVLEQLRRFVAERDWKKFHTPENLAKSISIEAAELLELFQWNNDVKAKSHYLNLRQLRKHYPSRVIG